MFKKITIENFKAHSEIEIDLSGKKNVLLYGENGAGKSSIYEAFKLIFFKDRLIQEASLPADPAQRRAKLNEMFVAYDKKGQGDFKLTFNGQPFAKDATAVGIDCNASMINMATCLPTNFEAGTFNLTEFIAREYFTTKVTSNDYELIQARVNDDLKKFHECFEIKIDFNGDIHLIDSSKQLDDKRITKFFNEGKINLAFLLLSFHIIKFNFNEAEKNILILDDFITSLDVANRTLLIRYLLTEFKGFQVLIFTHNIYFFNLINYLIAKEHILTDAGWAIFNLYERNNRTVLYEKSDRMKMEYLKERFNELKASGENEIHSFQSFGNDIRKKFERLLFEFSKLLTIGGVEETKNILDSIYKRNFAVLDIDKLLNVVGEDRINQGNVNNLKFSEFALVRDIILELKTYQKVMMHPLSHSTDYGEPSYSIKEIEVAIKLLDKLEKNIKDFINQKVEGA